MWKKSNPICFSNFDFASLTRGKVTLTLYEGRNLSLGSKEVGLEQMIPRSQFLSGLCFGRATTKTITSPPVSSNTHVVKIFNPPSSNSRGPPENFVRDPVHKRDLEDESMPVSNNKGPSNITNQLSSYWTANWYVPLSWRMSYELPLSTNFLSNRRKPQGKKNKTWDGDAYVSHVGDKLIMISEDGKM